MNTIKIAIYDESPRETARTARLLMHYDQFSAFDLSTFSEPSALLASQDTFDIVVLEIGAQEPNGYEIARILCSRVYRPVIFFLTDDPGYAHLGYGLARCYLQKPVSQELLDQALDDAIKTLFANRCVFESCGTTYLIRPQDIYYIETRGHLVAVYTKDEKIELWDQYKSIVKQLPQSAFVKPHKGFVVNLGAIHTMSPTTITLFDQSVIPVSRRSLVAVREKLRQFQHWYTGRTIQVSL